MPDDGSSGCGRPLPRTLRRRLFGLAAAAVVTPVAAAIADQPSSAADGAVLARGMRRTLILPVPPAPPAAAPAGPAVRTGLAAPAVQAPSRLPPPRLVTIDPGHGGKDPGAIGVSGTYEKHVALAAAQELRRQLEAGGQYRVELTRHDDVFIPLEDRVGIAQSRGAALFVSIHADALLDHDVRGASVYTLGDTASDAQTAALAARENSADRFAGPAFRNTTPDVARILASLVRQETRAGSIRLARDMVGALDEQLPMLPNPQRAAGFVVLKAADIPSVLVEMGFMSNPRDEAALREQNHRVMVAAAMKRALDAYFAAQDHTARNAG